MARDIKPRDSYTSDAGFLIRLSRAIERDERRDPAWKREVQGYLAKLITLLMDVKAAEPKK